MALRDRSQNHAFVYTNVYQLYKKAKESSLKSDSKVWRADELEGAKVTTFTPPTFTETQNIAPTKQDSPVVKTSSVNPFDDLKGNLKRLEDLHSRLRFMLKELEDLVGKKN